MIREKFGKSTFQFAKRFSQSNQFYWLNFFLFLISLSEKEIFIFLFFSLSQVHKLYISKRILFFSLFSLLSLLFCNFSPQSHFISIHFFSLKSYFIKIFLLQIENECKEKIKFLNLIQWKFFTLIFFERISFIVVVGFFFLFFLVFFLLFYSLWVGWVHKFVFLMANNQKSYSSLFFISLLSIRKKSKKKNKDQKLFFDVVGSENEEDVKVFLLENKECQLDVDFKCINKVFYFLFLFLFLFSFVVFKFLFSFC